MRTSSASARRNTPSAAAASKHAFRMPGLAKGERWRSRSSDALDYRKRQRFAPERRLPAELQHGGALLERAPIERNERQHDVRVGRDLLDAAELRADRLSRALAQPLPQQGEQHELAQRYPPVGLDHRGEIRREMHRAPAGAAP